LRGWHESLAEQPRRLRTGKGAKEQRYRPTADDPESIRRRRDTANRIRTILFAALNRAFEDGKVASDAAWRKVKPFRETGSARVRYLSLDECKRLMNACEPDFRQLVRGALVTGARYGELCRADVSDFNADASALLVRESKGGKPRWVPLDDAGAAFLEDITAGRAPIEPLFVRADGERWRPSHQTRPLQAACIAAKIAPCGFHQLRHSYASHRVMAGMPLIAIANVLGHSDTRMVEKHYGHLSPSYIREAVRATALDLGPIEGNVATLRPGAAA
jgi:integrase